MLLAGEADVGKSRLITEATVQAQRAEVRVLEGKCSLFESALPYAPFIEAFRGLLRARTSSQMAALLGPYAPEVMKLLPELAQLLPGLQPNPPLSPADEKSRLFESLYLVLRQIAAEAPLILALEDIHWADPASLELLHFLARRVRRDRWLVLATYRPEELSHTEGLSRVRHDLLRERLAQELMIKPLTALETGELLTQVLSGHENVPERFKAWIFQFGEGNPFFTEEILRAIVETGDDPATRLDPEALAGVAIPTSVRETILTRLNQLTHEARRVLSAAAILGRTFDLDALQEVSAFEGDAFTQACMSLLSLQLIRADRTPLRYGFRHHLIREVVIQNIAPDVRRALHCRVGEWMEAQPSPGATPQVLVHHFHEAGDRDKTVHYAMTAASQASSVYAHEEAARYYDLVLKVLPEDAVEARLRSAEALGDALHYSGRFDRAVEAYTLMLQWAETAAMRPRMARAYRKIGRAQSEQTPGVGLAALEKGLATLSESDDPAEEALIRELVSIQAKFMGHIDRAEAEAKAGVAAAERSGDPAVLGRAYRFLKTCLPHREQGAETRAYAEKALELARQAHDIEGELLASHSAGWVALVDADFPRAREILERSAGLVERVGAVPSLLGGVVTLAELSLLDGRWDEAEAIASRVAKDLDERYDRPWPYAFAVLELGTISLLRGRLEEAEALLLEARGQPGGAYGPRMLILANLARLELRRSDVAAALTRLEEARRIGEDTGLTEEYFSEALLLAAEAHLRAGQTAAARSMLERAAESAKHFRYLAPVVFRVRGEVTAHEGNLDAAIPNYQAGLVHPATAAQPYQDALLRYHLGVCLLRRSGPGDRKSARAHLTEALAILERLGAKPDADMVRQAMQRIGGRTPSGHALTEREREVLTLLADGLSNAAIAGRLYISERTVEAHVSHILTKLSLETRVQAASWAAQHPITRLD